MIRVNLLASTAGHTLKRELVPTEQRGAMIGLAMLLVTSVAMGGWWWMVQRDRLATERTIAVDEVEVMRLKDVAKLVDRASARRAELAERLSLIDRLRSTKRGPVTLLETISESLPDGLWLSELKQTGATVQMEGRAVSLTAITDFAEKLQNSAVFERPVEIVTTTAETLETTPVVRFIVRATSLNKGPEIAAATPTTPAAPAKGM
jgi:type IV pilus assembly protein PilN